MKRLKVAMVVHEAEEGGYWAAFPELPGCFTQGETLEELRRHAAEAVAGWLVTMRSEGQPLPETGDSVEAIEAEFEEVA
ncbi:MAG: type II toxin-antitoxin system HicB family antitoxin [Candidatus Lambdaproteobacteria bacterium]|nr:type II toxin-antitoxin system HicB family antitoxin [Candidatus Lambdaproteobacteria bacterium]